MNIQNLRQKSELKTIEYQQLTIKIPKDQHDLIVQNNIDPQILVLEAFKEVAATLDKEQTLKSIAVNTREFIQQERRGDIVVTDTKPKIDITSKILSTLKTNPRISATDLLAFIHCNPSSLYQCLKVMEKNNVIQSSGLGFKNDPKVYSIVGQTDSEFDKMFPKKGPVISLMG